jgi:SAM-dependent methyltransferase
MEAKKRFSSRVENYVKYRPGYPAEIIRTLQAECGLSSDSVIADIGSGTGLLALRFLEAGCRVTGVEPNADMRRAGDALLAGYPTFTSRDGSAEETGLPAGSVDFAVAGQAFHWFDAALARVEFRRILRPAGWAALVWNERREDSTPFLRDYEALLQTYATDYNQVNHRNVEEDADTIPAFFGGEYCVALYENVQRFDFAGVRGRLLSSSYAPEEGQPGYAEMLVELQRIFDRHAEGGIVAFEYDTRMFYGRMG